MELTRKSSKSKSITEDYISIAIEKESNIDINEEEDSLPWIKYNFIKEVKSPGELFNRELLEFIKYISPQKEEKFMREHVIGSINHILKSIYKNCQLFVFGSWDTEVYLPTSDIDIVLIESCIEKNNLKKEMYKIAAHFKRKDLVSKITVIYKARVPIIKLIDKETGYNVDISINIKNGLESASITKKYLERYPSLKHLVMITKFILNERKLNEVFIGGVGSYTILLMITSFLQMHPLIQSKAIDEMESIGSLFLDFLELFGKRFNFRQVGIKISKGGEYFDKKRRDYDYRVDDLLTLEDPQDETNDVARGSHKYLKVKMVLSHIFDTLISSIFASNSEFKRLQNCKPKDWSILNHVINLNPIMLKDRENIKTLYSSLNEKDIELSIIKFKNSITKTPEISRKRNRSSSPINNYNNNNNNNNNLNQINGQRKKSLESRLNFSRR